MDMKPYDEKRLAEEKRRLRPIGSEFDHIGYPSTRTTDQHAYLYRYRVIGHNKVARFMGDTIGRWAESVECVDIKRSKTPHDTFPFVNGYMITDWGFGVALGLQTPPEFE